MFEWFEKMIREVIWKAIADFVEALPGMAEDKLYEFLHDLKAGEVLASSPLVKIIAVNDAEETVTVLVRGAFPFSGVTPFMRIEAVISRARADIHVTGEDPPIRIKQWQTVLGDLSVKSEGKYKGALGFGFDGERGSWMGQGSLKLIPLGIGAAIYGGFSERGLVLGLDGELPKGASIPLGPTGLGLRGIGGDFAYNFVARLEKEGMPIAHPTAEDYVKWARDTGSIDRWMAGPIDHTSVGVGIRTIICTKADEGFAFELNPVGFAFLLPGGTFIFGGKGKLLQKEGFGAEGFFVFDADSASLALGVGVNVDLELLDGSGQLDLFFSFSDPDAWYLDLGTESKPVKLEVLKKVPVIRLLFSQKAEAYFRINHHRIAFGGTLAIGGSFEIGDILKLFAKLAVSLHAYVGWDPLLVNARIKVHGEIGIKIWKFEFVLSGDADAEVYFPTPTLFRFEIKGNLNLPWPIPDVSFSKSFGDDVVRPPSISSPLAAGTYVINGASTVQQKPVDAIHIISDLQWNLDTDKPWPDLELVVPFSKRVTDRTGKVEASQAVSPAVQGGYTVTDELLELELTDLVHGVPVPDVRAVWADGPGGSTAQLHVLGCDPYAWMTAKIDTSTFPLGSPEKTVDTFFGYGSPQLLSAAPQRFAAFELTPAAEGDRLLTAFRPEIPTRVLETGGFSLRFETQGGGSFLVSKVVLFLIVASSRRFPNVPKLVTEDGITAVYQDHGTVFSNLRLVSARFAFPVPVDRISVRSAAERQQRFYVYAIRYQEAAQASTGSISKKLLMPGRYRLHLKGASTAVHPSGSGASSPLPPASPVDWFYDKEFEVAYPETLRPYIFYSTFGDTKLFSKVQYPWTQWTLDTWNPTQFGFGFPLYRGYKAAVRFMVPYVSGIFAQAPLKFRITYEHGGVITETLLPQSVSDGTSSLPPESRNWIAAHGGTAAPDQEVVMSSLPAESGPAKLTILFDHPQSGEVRIDEWSGCVSAFTGFRAHLAWPHTCLSVYYDAAGRHTTTECPLPESNKIHKFGKIDPVRHYREASGIGSIVLDKRLPINPLTPIGEIRPIPDLPVIPIPVPLKPYPVELTAPPVSWRLPAGLASLIGPLNETSALRFTGFAAETGAKFGLGSVMLSGINDTVTATTIEAVCDTEGRPYALWLRTPEPVDWRRVTLTLSVRHTAPDKGCPTSYAHRRALALEVLALPGFDGSSAFLTGSLGGIPTRLPRGEYTLTLAFDPFKTGLPRLYPGDSAGPMPETAVLRFVQPLGLTWPLPFALRPFPWHLPDKIPTPIPLPIPIHVPRPDPVPFPRPGRLLERLNESGLRLADDQQYRGNALENIRDALLGGPGEGSGGNTDIQDHSHEETPPAPAGRNAFIHLPLPGEFPVADLTAAMKKGGDTP
ncbi:hypothetical protein GCM10010911_55880 [Paenibacillus nasutitermitis]|uniref:Uncharacterized protein n=2 Tax=Paenibacillus nasutitermitis TaxID=1652958 RepID=A0A916ZEL6_9BACL|nr:hypothetical protein GCM10010911_55880 [Paenibacillus nasutitermitis]